MGGDMQNQSVTDDQELAKVLAGVTQQTDDNLNFEETGTTPQPDDTQVVAPPPDNSIPVATDDLMVAPPPAVPISVDAATPVAPVSDSNLDSIKQQALLELRPLVDKLNISPEEKFDTYLLLLRSTDDSALIAPAHAAAGAIADESRRAQALLDVIKEIDYLSNPQK